MNLPLISKLFLVLVFGLLVASQKLRTPAENAKLIADLIVAPNAIGKIEILSDDTDFVFDFYNPGQKRSQGNGGFAVGATKAVFPALVGNGIAMTVGILKPCGLNTPHTHPRATEFNLIVNGTGPILVGMLQENGARFVMNHIIPGQSTVFPKGSIHFEQNLGCDDAFFVAAFSDEDPGTSQIAQNFFGANSDGQAVFGMPSGIVGAALGGLGVVQVQDIQSKIPKSIALGVRECLTKCGIQAPSYILEG